MSGGGGGSSREEERRKLADIINHWNANRLDLFEISDPTEVSDPAAAPTFARPAAARPGPARHPLRAAREVRHRARARPRPPPPRGQLGPPRRPPSRRPGGSGTGLPPLSANARPALAGEEAPLLGGEGRGGSVGPPLPCPERLV